MLTYRAVDTPKLNNIGRWVGKWHGKNLFGLSGIGDLWKRQPIGLSIE